MIELEQLGQKIIFPFVLIRRNRNNVLLPIFSSSVCIVRGITGFGIAPFATAEQTIRFAILAEKFGINGGFWLGEGLHGRSATSLLSAVATQTKKIQLGTAIIGVYNRHPAVIAMEAVTLDELSGGRFNLGIGVNVSSLVMHGLTKSATTVKDQKPYEAMKDSIAIIRGLLSGEKVVYNGVVFKLPEPGGALDFHGFKLIRKNLPLFIGSRSPKILELAGRKADGVILSRSMSASGSYVIDSLKHIFDGAKSVGRSNDDLIIASNLTFSVDKDSNAAKDHTKKVVAMYVADPTLTASDLMKQHSRVRPQDLESVKNAFEVGGILRAAESVSSEMIDELTISGTSDECVAKIEKLGNLGVNIPIAFDLLGPKPEEAIELIAKEIIPRIRTN
jgi:5,10-methylenetetrahydromethanopterin reductase